ncbi:MAG TPA: GntR family transcriptional regulator [Thermoanaerobaculia bacterium]|jgi:GntR family transcriptional regulator|nr:GntR family transcriptional regulator [Thermoanaerobaculia bacterium]
MFDINASDAAPIWQQIENGMRRMIALGALNPGDAVPSVRDLARTLRVNPNTVARAYQRLTDRGVFSVRRGDGTYVADQPVQPKKAERNEKLRDAAMQYAGVAISLGASEQDAIAELENSFGRMVKESRRKS